MTSEPASTSDAYFTAFMRGPVGVRAWLWRVLGSPMLHASFHNWYGTRRRLLNMFGARVERGARVRPSATITMPWNLTLGAHSAIGDHAVIDSAEPVRIGRRCTISQYSYLATREPDPQSPAGARAGPITIEDDCWVASDVYVAPGVTISTDTVVGSRSSVWESLSPRGIAAGDRARRLAERVCQQPQPMDIGVRASVSSSVEHESEAR